MAWFSSCEPWEHMQSSLERILNHSHLISTMITCMMIGRPSMLTPHLWWDFPFSPQYGALSTVYEMLIECGTGDSHNSMCTYCKIESHTTDACKKQQRTREWGNKEQSIWSQCGLPGQVKVDWVSYKHIKKSWKVNKATATAALATTRDYIPFWQMAYAHAATATMAPLWVFHSVASHYVRNDCSCFSKVIKLSLPTVIEFGDNNSFTTTHYGFVDIIQGCQVEALHTPTFRLSFLPINQLDLGGYITVFHNGKCSITLPSSCSLTRKPINNIYIIVPMTTVLSSTTKNRKRSKRNSSPTIEHTIEPTIKSSRAPITAKTKSTRKSLRISKSRI